MNDDKIVNFEDWKRERQAVNHIENPTTPKSIAGIALKAALFLSTGKIDVATATRIGAATQRARDALEEGQEVDDKSVAELRNAEKTLTQADRA